MFNKRFELSSVMRADALFARASVLEPLKIKSSPRFPRNDFMDCSPSTNRKASATFDLPEPFGPTIEVIGDPKSSAVFLANDLKPESSILFKYIGKL